MKLATRGSSSQSVHESQSMVTEGAERARPRAGHNGVGSRRTHFTHFNNYLRFFALVSALMFLFFPSDSPSSTMAFLTSLLRVPTILSSLVFQLPVLFLPTRRTVA